MIMMYEQGKDNKQRRKFHECVCGVLAMLFPLPISGISGGREETKEKR